MNNLTNTQRLTISGIIMALYIVVMVVTQGFAFGQYQVRIATSLYGLSALFPFSILSFGFANLISNTIMGGLGIVDSIGGFCVGILTTAIIAFGKKRGLGNWIVIPAITLVPGLIVPAWLSMLLHIPYLVLVSSIIVGQFICGVTSFFLVNALERVLPVSLIGKRNLTSESMESRVSYEQR